MKFTETGRGFALLEFTDNSGNRCTMQKSSSGLEDKVWLGIDDPNPQVLHSHAADLGIETDAECGWEDYPIDPKVHITTRMHLNKRQALDLAKKLIDFAFTGKVA